MVVVVTVVLIVVPAVAVVVPRLRLSFIICCSTTDVIYKDAF